MNSAYAFYTVNVIKSYLSEGIEYKNIVREVLSMPEYPFEAALNFSN